MNTHAAIHIAKLCGAVDPSVSGQTVYEAAVLGMSFELRLVYIANDDLIFINQCTHLWDEYAAGMHREPYYSVALSDSGQTFIISLDHEPVWEPSAFLVAENPACSRAVSSCISALMMIPPTSENWRQ